MARLPLRGTTPRRVRRTILSAVAAAALALPLAAGPAGATMAVRDHYSDDYGFSFDDCGFWVDAVGHDQGIALIRAGKGDLASAFYLHDNYEFVETWTRRDTGAFITVSGNGVFQETKATRVTGTVFAFTSINAGQPFVVRDSDGDLIMRDRGVIRQVLEFDTLGDDVPGGEFVADVSFSVSGPHPGLAFDPCPLFD